MSIKRVPSTCMLVLALTTDAGSATYVQAPPLSPPPSGMCTPEQRMHTITADDAKTLDAAFLEAKAFLDGCSSDEGLVEITLNTPGPHVLRGITSKGTVAINPGS